MNKSQLIENVACRAGISVKDSDFFVNAFFNLLKKAMSRGERIEVRGFGSFSLKNYRAYLGRNPKTGSSIIVKPKRLPSFRPSKDLKEMVNPDSVSTPLSPSSLSSDMPISKQP
jgi:integration host factor subunit beta